MTEKHETGNSQPTRRSFLKTSTVAVSSTLAAGALATQVYAAGSDQIKIGLIGCGSRGKGAVENALNAAKGVEVIALTDVFSHKVKEARDQLQKIAGQEEVKALGNKADLAEERCFTGLDGYQKVLAIPEVNYVILATPPGFRPLHIAATVAAGKHMFAEKPVAADAAGIRQILAAYEIAVQKSLRMTAGTQRRHQNGYIETIKRLQDGAIGKIMLVRAYWNTDAIWFNPRSSMAGLGEKPTDVGYQLHNWYHFCWISGDHICEQHVHNLDVGNWVMNAHPIRAWGMGSRTPGNPSRPAGKPEDTGNIFDNFSIEFEYPDQTRMISQCRQVPNCWNMVREYVHGEKGNSLPAGMINNKKVRCEINEPYVQEHTDLIEAIRGSKPLNELKTVAESTLTAIMGRMAAYTGKEVTWDKALNSKEDFVDEAALTWDTPLPVPPVPIPGKTPLV